MVDNARIDRGPAAYRGFLFPDMRGFTAFAERYGNTAAAAKVRSFLEIARKAIANHEGAEIKTEGDAIHAVFPSASSAVLCGLDIVDAAAELNKQEPDRPLNLGVGVHAGEAVETAEGYIGTAVNLAARVCAAARPGEVLVTSTVKGITQASIPIGFIARGHMRLKGIREPVEVYAATRDMTAGALRAARSNRVLGGAAVGLAAVLVIAAILTPQLLSNLGGSAKASPTPGVPVSTQPAAQPLAIGALPVGKYTSTSFQPPITFSIGDLGWAASRDLPQMLGLLHDGAPRGSVYFLRVSEVITNPCVDAGDAGETKPPVTDVIAELQALGHLTMDPPKPVPVGGVTGQQVEITVSDGALAACGGLSGAEVSLLGVGQETWRVSSGERFRLITVPVGAQPLTIILSVDWTQTHSVQEMEDLFEIGQRVIDSVRF